MDPKLMTDLQAAVATVDDKKAALAKAQSVLQTAMAKAQGAVTTANEEYQNALDVAQDLRRQLEADLNTSLPANDNRIR